MTKKFEPLLGLCVRFLKSNVSFVVLLAVFLYFTHNSVKHVLWGREAPNSGQLIIMIVVLIGLLLDLWLGKRSALKSLTKFTMHPKSLYGNTLEAISPRSDLPEFRKRLREVSRHSDKVIFPRSDLPDFRKRLREISTHGNKRSIVIAAYGPSLAGLIVTYRDLFLEHLNNGGTLLFGFLSPDSLSPRFETDTWKDEGGLESAIRRTIKTIERLNEVKKDGVIEYETFDALPEGSALILDLNGPLEQTQYQLDVGGCPPDLKPVYVSDGPTYMHHAIKSSWEAVWPASDSEYMQPKGENSEMKAKIFIASSVEGLEIARAIQSELDYDFQTEIWNQSHVFQLGASPIEALENALDEYDFGIFVFTPDDEIESRGQVKRVARDNVIFEAGLFIGKHGRFRSYMVVPRGVEIQVPSDLQNLTTANYDPTKDNLASAVGPACEKIRKSVKDSYRAAP